MKAMKNMLKKVMEPPNGREPNLIKDRIIANAMDTAENIICLVLLLVSFLVDGMRVRRSRMRTIRIP